MMLSVKSIVQALGGAKAIADALEMPGGPDAGRTVRAWVCRDSIPAAWFCDLEALARGKGVEGVTVSSLADLQKAKRLRQHSSAA